MAGCFEGFSSAGLDFLRRLGSQDKAWFDANRNTYESEVVAPTKAFVVAVGQRLDRGAAPGIVAQPRANGSIAPIHNDLRFSPDKRSYKDHLLLRFWQGDGAKDKKSAPTLFIRLPSKEVGFATGAMLSDLERWRQRIDDEATGAALARALKKLGKGRSLEVAGEGYKRVPKPFAEDHPRAALLRHKMFQARCAEPVPASVGTARFVDHCVKRLEACAEVHRWLVANL